MRKCSGAYILSFFAVVFTFFQPENSAGQKIPDEITFERISIPGTIRSSQISNIVQDRSGVLWFAGHGLFRYDGYGFKQYRTVADTAGTINPSDIHALLYDFRANRILLGTHRFGVLAYAYADDVLLKLPCGQEPPVVNQLAQTADGKVWAASFQEGVFYLENDSLKKLPDPHGMYPHPTSLLAHKNRIYVGGPAKVVILQDGTPIEEIILSFHGDELPIHADVTAMHVDRENRLWIGTRKQGVLVYDLEQKVFTKHFTPDTAPFFSLISAIHQDRDGLFWILTKADGLVVYAPADDKLIHLRKDPFSPKSIATDNCFSLLEDTSGIIWIGGTGDISKFDKDQLKFTHIYHNPLNKISLSDNMVRAVYEDEDGKIWVGTDAGYVNVIDFKARHVEHRRVMVAGSDQRYVPAYFQPLDDDRVLVATYNGLLQWSRRTGTFAPYAPLWNFTRDRVVRQILKKGDRLYFISQGELFEYNLLTQKLNRTVEAGDPRARNLTTVYLDDQQRLWVGSSAGISLLDDSRNEFRFFGFKKLPAGWDGTFLLVLSIQQAGDYLYTGTFNAGLWRLDLRTLDDEPLIENFTARDGLTSNTIYASLPDKDGHLWLTSNAGILRFDPHTNDVIGFAITEGMQEEEFNRLAYSQLRDGRMVFGGINGINIFHPADIRLRDGNFEPSLLSVRVYNPIAGTEKITTDLSLHDELVLPYNENFLDIRFFVPHYANPRRYSLYYRLENFENDWKEVSTDNTASFTNISPGNYVFAVKTLGLADDEHVTRLSITISPPYWKTWWFILLSFLVVSFLVMTIIRSYIRKGHHDRQRLQELLRIRTFEIEKSREELKVLNQKKDLIFSILSHDLRSPLTTLKGFLGYLIDHAHELTDEELKRHAINIKNSVTNSLDLIDNTLFWSLSQMGNIQYTPSNFSLYYLLEKLRGLYQLTADKKRITFSIHCPHDMMVYGDENMIYVTLRNLVSNALKFTTEGKRVTITCWPNDKYAHIDVTDEGIGMSDEYLRKIQSSGQPMLKKGTSNEKGTGLGLLLCIQFIGMNKGEMAIRSVENEGTTFTVKLPLAEKPTSIDQPRK